jgi:cellulose synthase (UDP-forming)
VLFVLLVGADLFNGFHSASFWLTCLKRPRRRPFLQVPNVVVDVLIPTYNEPPDVLEPTIRGALALRRVRPRVLVLDDGGREEIEDLANRLGAVYVARDEHVGAKAGNINHALRATAEGGAVFVCVFDSDHVPRPEFLERTLGFFVDPRVALVQTPQIYANADAGPLTHGSAQQQAIFFGPICNGRDGFNSSFCCGTNFVARRKALASVDGFPEDSITEDIVLSTRLVGQGYDIVYVDDELSAGLGPEDARSYVSQQLRWATGCLDLLLRRPAVWRPLSWTQRWQYLVATSYWLSGWTIACYLCMPVARLLFGYQPINASASDVDFVAHFLPYFLLSIVNLGRYTAGGYGISGLALNWGSFPIHIRATLRVVFNRAGGFTVTSKKALSGVPWMPLRANVAVIAALIGACAYGLSRGLTPASVNNAAFAVLNATFVGLIVPFAIRQARRTARETERVIEPVVEPIGRQQPIEALEAA